MGRSAGREERFQNEKKKGESRVRKENSKTLGNLFPANYWGAATRTRTSWEPPGGDFNTGEKDRPVAKLEKSAEEGKKLALDHRERQNPTKGK